MTRFKVDHIRNVAFCGHGAAGKTTLVDHLLQKTGKVGGIHNVADGTSICDFDPEEKQHKYTIEAKLAHFDYQDHRFHVIDTPGYPEFIGQTIGAMHGVDCALVVINAHSGIEVNTRRVFNEAGKAGLGRMIVINKMDTDNIQFEKLLADIRELWGNRCVLLNVPLGHGAAFRGVASTLDSPSDMKGALIDPATIHDSLVESIIEIDEQVMARYLEGVSPSREEIAHLLEKGVADGLLVPIVCCAGKADIGVTELLDAMITCCPSPADHHVKAIKNGHDVEVSPDANGPLLARVFRTRIDPFVQKLSFVRIFAGRLKKDEIIHVSGARKQVKLGPPLEVVANESHAIDEAGPGELVAFAKMEDLHTGTVLGDYEMKPIAFPRPMVGLAVTPKSRNDETKLSGALHKVVEEDPCFRIDRDPQTKETVITGMSELHLAIVRERLHRREKLDVDAKEPKIPFRETIQQKAEGMYRHKKQSGGRGQFGEVHIHMLPFPRGIKPEDFCTKERFPHMKEFHYDAAHNFLWVNSVVGGSIPGNFLPAVEKGFKERLERGVVAGYAVQDVCVDVHFGKYHEVDSSEQAFKTAGAMVFRNVFQQAKPGLLEPIARMEITVPQAHVGDVFSDMSGRRGRVLGSDNAGGGMTTVNAECPLMELTTYARSLSSMTGGQGSFTLELSHYDVMPPNVQQEIISKNKMAEEEEE